MAGKVKKTAQGGQDHLGAHGAFNKETAQEGGIPQLPTAYLDGYFSALANADTTEKVILAALVKSNTTLTTSNVSLTATVANLQKQFANIGKTPHREPTRQRINFPNCKKDVYHFPEDCCELKKNDHLMHPGWRSRLL